ncbi:hypothetical protein ACVW00_000577 [Marmoricola sp. URHA0025 HA25]
MNDLDTLLRAASDQPPAGHLDPQALLRAGRSRVRRRRAVARIAGVAVVGMLGGVAALAGGGPDATPQPAAQRTLTLGDAVDARSGADYEVLQTFTGHSSDSAMSGQFVRGVLPDGTTVVQSYPHGSDGVSRIALVGASGTRTVDVPRWAENYLGATAHALVFGTPTSMGLSVLDLSSLEWSHAVAGQDVDTNVPAQPLTSTSGRPGQVFLAASKFAGRSTRQILAVDLDRSTATVVAKGGDVAASGDHVAWTAAYDAPNDRVVVRDLTTGKDTSFDPHTGRCDQKDLGVTADRVVVMVNCADAGSEKTETDVVDRIDVFDLAGHPLARITGDELGPVRMTGRFLTVSSWKKDQTGSYTYDLETGRFLRVEDSMSGLAGNETGSGSTLVWQRRLDGDNGGTYVVAAMR